MHDIFMSYSYVILYWIKHSTVIIEDEIRSIKDLHTHRQTNKHNQTKQQHRIAGNSTIKVSF